MVWDGGRRAKPLLFVVKRILSIAGIVSLQNQKWVELKGQRMHIYGNTGCGVSKWGDSKLEMFFAIPKANY